MLGLPLGARADGPAYLVKDINARELFTLDNGLGAPPVMASFHGNAYFPVLDRQAGPGLWRSDGTADGTVRIKDGHVGEPWSDGRAVLGGLTVADDALYFVVGSDGHEGSEIWKTDGTSAPAMRVFTTADDTALIDLAAVGSAVFFIVSTTRDMEYGVGAELWKSDGTANGAVRVRTFPASRARELHLARMTAANGALFVAINDGDGFDLWRSDGTADGTVRLTDMRATLFYDLLSDGRGTLFFTILNSFGVSLWRSDGSEAGAMPIASGVSGGSLTLANGTVFFDGSDMFTGTEMWAGDGSEAGAYRVADIWPGINGSYPTQLVDLNGTLVFAADDGSGPGLWRTDGTESGTRFVAALSRFPFQVVNAGGTLYFADEDPSSGSELWRSDATALGTAMVKDIRPGRVGSSPSVLTDVDGTLFFFADNGHDGWELWKSDGTAVGTVQVINLFRETLGSNPIALTDVGGVLFFAADDGNYGGELWRSDGTAAGTRRVRNINPLPAASSLPIWPTCLPYCGTLPELRAMDDTLYFAADDGSSGVELWKSDGAEAGTMRVKDINAGVYGSQPFGLTAWRGALFFWASDGQGYDLWKTDGTEAGTVVVRDINSYVVPAAGDRPLLVEMNGSLYFAADDEGPSGRELWKTDGTTDGTVQVADVIPGSAGSSPSELTNASGTLYFATVEAYTSRSALWKSDGTADGTVPVGDFVAVSGLTAVNGTLVFLGQDRLGPWQVWRTDGSAAGTQPLVDVTVIPDVYWYTRAVFDGSIFFLAGNANGIGQLWRTDGTTVGTIAVQDIGPSPLFESRALTAVGGMLFFGVGNQIWRSDGTQAGTVPIQDVGLPGWFSGFVGAGDHVFFTADGGAGVELWAMPFSPLRCGGDCDGDGAVRVDELITGIAIALGDMPMNACGSLDAAGDGRVTVDEEIAAVKHALVGCGD